MIAPEPALAGPRPAATSRENGRAAEPLPRKGGDFDSVLAEPAQAGEPRRKKGGDPEPVPAEPELEAAPGAAEAGQPPVPALPAPVDAALALVAVPVAVKAEAPADKAAADVALVPAPVQPATAFRAAAVPASAVHAEAPPTEDGGAAASGNAPEVDAEAVPVDDPAPLAKAGRAVAVPVAMPLPVVAPLPEAAPLPAGPVPSEIAAPRRAVTGAEALVAGVMRKVEVAGQGSEAVVQAVTLREAAPPAWQLAADPGPARAEAVVQPPSQAVQAAQPQAVIGQVAVAIGKAGDATLEIRLDPPELGRVQIHLTRHDGGIHAVVLADRPETQDLLRRHAEGLARELGQAGYDTVSLDFAAGHEARGGRDQAPALDWAQVAAEAPVAAAAEAAPAAAPRRSLAGGLDIRL